MDDFDLWAYVTRHVKPLKKDTDTKKMPAKTASPGTIKYSKTQSFQVPTNLKIDSLKPYQEQIDLPSHEIDGRTRKRLKRGQIAWQSTVDLHGLGQVQARTLLTSSLQSAVQRGERCVLVITGKGRGIESLFKGYGVLRKAVPEWLSESPLREIVLAKSQALPKHGGEGALYIQA